MCARWPSTWQSCRIFPRFSVRGTLLHPWRTPTTRATVMGQSNLFDVVVDCRMVVWCQMRAGSTWICCAWHRLCSQRGSSCRTNDGCCTVTSSSAFGPPLVNSVSNSDVWLGRHSRMSASQSTIPLESKSPTCSFHPLATSMPSILSWLFCASILFS